ncbi:FHA domain-containing protein FhaB/FipA [Leucobacter sp. UCMA 4100]|uniref:FHA domain-containing protein FhaB/FipA n=1 Tax=Leucobacter sp. UCMA 4100 TaxID=2810534 RepID=UPI002FDBD63B
MSEMSELTLMVLRLGFLLILWLFVFSVIFALRSDLFGAPVRRLKKSDTPVASGGSPVSSPPAPQPAGAPMHQGTAPVVTPSGGALPSAGSSPVSGSGGPAKQLVILTGVAEGTSIPLDDGHVTIGRSPDSTLVIVDEYTSTYHAKLQRSGDQWSITDLDSTNGTKVSGQRITQPMPLPTFTPVTIGTTTFELRP